MRAVSHRQWCALVEALRGHDCELTLHGELSVGDLLIRVREASVDRRELVKEVQEAKVGRNYKRQFSRRIKGRGADDGGRRFNCEQRVKPGARETVPGDLDMPTLGGPSHPCPLSASLLLISTQRQPSPDDTNTT